MTGKGSKKPRGWVSYNRTELKAIVADGGNVADAVQVKIHKAEMLLEKLINCKLFLIGRNIWYKRIRTLRLKMVHQRNSLAGEKRLIKDLRLAEEETRANVIIVANGITNNCNYEKDKKRIEVSIGELVQPRMAPKVKKAQIVELDKEIKLWEEELMKINEVKEEMEIFIFLYGDADAAESSVP